jgi:hypothetical protein
MKQPEKLPDAVCEGIKRFARNHGLNPVQLLSPDTLKWDSLMGCYFFYRGNVFHGVELDGHIHT